MENTKLTYNINTIFESKGRKHFSFSTWIAFLPLFTNQIKFTWKNDTKNWILSLFNPQAQNPNKIKTNLKIMKFLGSII